MWASQSSPKKSVQEQSILAGLNGARNCRLSNSSSRWPMQRRCLVPADGFFEWKKTGPKEKQAYNFGLATGCVFAFAGLWDRWRDPNNNVLETCTILTTMPNSLVAEVHDRMPAILDPDDYERWLDPGITNSEMILDCLKPFDATLMSKYPVSPRVNRPENDDEECAREVSVEKPAPTLF